MTRVLDLGPIGSVSGPTREGADQGFAMMPARSDSRTSSASEPARILRWLIRAGHPRRLEGPQQAPEASGQANGDM
jgi:hypothetical protein